MDNGQIYSLDDLIESQSKKFHIKFDWLSFVIPIKSENHNDLLNSAIAKIEYFSELFFFSFLDELQTRNNMNNYNNCYSLGNFVSFRCLGDYTKMKVITTDSDGNETVDFVDTMQIEITGQGLRELEDRGFTDYINLFKIVLNDFEGKCTRIDIAIDDLKGDIVNLRWLQYMCDNKLYTSSFRNEPIPHGTHDRGLSLEFGSVNSNLQLLIYDKKLERKYRGDNYEGDFWTRYEMRYRKEKADLCCNYLLDTKMEDISEFAKEQLFGMLDIKEVNNFNKNNQFKVKTNKKWKDFLDNVSKSKFTCETNKNTEVQRSVNWYMRTLMRCGYVFELSEVVSSNTYSDPCMGFQILYLNNIKKYVEENGLKSEDIAKINHFRILQGLDILDPLTAKKDYLSNLNNRIFDLELNYRITNDEESIF